MVFKEHGLVGLQIFFHRREAAHGVGDADGLRRRQLVMHQQLADEENLEILFARRARSGRLPPVAEWRGARVVARPSLDSVFGLGRRLKLGFPSLRNDVTEAGSIKPAKSQR